MFGNEEKVAPHDIQQGGLGDCYFLAACSALAEDEDRFVQLFENKEINDQGIYGFNVWIKGVPTKIAIDDYFPGRGWNGDWELRYAQPGETGALWSSILEKLWAKVNGNYAQINGGYVPEALDFLTGVPTAVYQVDDLDEERTW